MSKSKNNINPLNIKHIKECIKFSVKNSHEIKLPLMLWGEHGIGKTEIVKQVATELDYNLIVLHLATQDIIDLIGRPITLNDGETQVQDWTVPMWLHRAQKFEQPTIFFLDEFNRGPRIVLNAMLPFLIEGVLHTHRIGVKDAVIAACNPPSSDYDVNALYDGALLDRLGHIIMKPTKNDYIKYLKSIGMDETTLSVVSGSNTYVDIDTIDIGFTVKPSRRSIVNVLSVFNKQTTQWIEKHGSYILMTYLGYDFSQDWMSKFLYQKDNLSIEKIKNHSKYKKEITKYLSCEIDGNVTTKLAALERCNALIETEISDGITPKDAKWITDFYSNEMIPDEEIIKSISMNKIIQEAMWDKDINRIFGQFFESRNLTPIHSEIW